MTASNLQNLDQDSVVSQLKTLQRQASSLLLYQAVLADDMGQSLLHLLDSLLEALQCPESSLACLKAYGAWFQTQAQYQQSGSEHLLNQLLNTENPFTQQAQKTEFKLLPTALVTAAQSDLQALQQLYSCRPEQLSQWVQLATSLSNPPVAWLSQVSPGTEALQGQGLQSQASQIQALLMSLDNWSEAVEPLADHYYKFGAGGFACMMAFRWQRGELLPVGHPDPVNLEQLVGYEFQRDLLIKNTEFLLEGFPAQNVLLYGSRGSGKSSLVKALLNHYSHRGLRLIEVAKSDLHDLPLVIEQLRGTPQKFIIFVDDLSFEEDDDIFKALKVVLEGNITARPQNVVVYATSNRRHLVREFFEDRPRPSDQDEIHTWDTVQEKLSFSDRFGLTLTFEPADQNTYLQIVRHLAQQAALTLSSEDLEFQALQWATRHNGRSGRTARQFIDFLTAEQALGKLKG
ncbi:MAG: ATP-binding protein [Microcoleaceae cyanobacterium]